MFARITTFLFAVLLVSTPALGQVSPDAPLTDLGPYDQVPQSYEILGISVEGVESDNTRAFVQQASGLRVGQNVTLPSDQAFADAIRNIYRLGLFSDVKVVEERRAGNGVFLAISVKEEPRLTDYAFQGVKKGHRDDLQKAVPIIKGTPVRPAEIERSIQVVRDFYREKGFLLTKVQVNEVPAGDNAVRLEFVVDRGPKVEIGEVDIEGNQLVSDSRLRRQMKETKEDRWWRFWKSATFERDEYEQDLEGNLQRLLDRRGEVTALFRLAGDRFELFRDCRESRSPPPVAGPRWAGTRASWSARCEPSSPGCACVPAPSRTAAPPTRRGRVRQNRRSTTWARAPTAAASAAAPTPRRRHRGRAKTRGAG